ncbi:MAG: right-handed parallel beta-helix repeat-containing protein [bacterium]
MKTARRTERIRLTEGRMLLKGLALCIAGSVFLSIIGFHGLNRAAADTPLGEVAIYWPQVQGLMSLKEQDACANYLSRHLGPTIQKTLFSGSNQETVNTLNSWMQARLEDGNLDVLLIIDLCPSRVYQGEIDGSVAEQWMESGNMLIWTGSEPFGGSVGTDGKVQDYRAQANGANNVLDVSLSGLCRGGGLQEPTTAVRDYGDPDGDYDISSFVEYTASYALCYDQLLINALSSDWHHMSFWRVEEIFAENSENYQSDNIILMNTAGGRYGQFYCVPGFNRARMEVITQVINNWLALPCQTLVVPSSKYATIQSAIDAARPRDTVLVKAGTYYEQLVMKRGIKLVSDAAGSGGSLVAGPGYADTLYGEESKKVLARAVATVIDGTGFPSGTSASPMIDFPKGATVGTLVDGFTITHMPAVDHTLPGHAHTLQMRGASGTVINCIVNDNGSSGIGSHALFHGEDTGTPYGQLDFRYTNIKYDSHPIVINNVVFRNEGNNLGNNHYAYAIFYNNECFESISVDDHDSPGIGNQHGAHALIVGNLVYKSAWVGIGGRAGVKQGRFAVNRPTHPTVRKNRVYDSGQNDTSGTGECGAGIGADDTGGLDPKTGSMVYHIIEENYVNGAANAAIGCRSEGTDTGWGYVRIANNEVTGGGQGGYGAGIGINGAHASEISTNRTYANHDAGIGIRNGGTCGKISGNISYANGAAGIGLMLGASVAEISNNELTDNGTAGIGHEGDGQRVSVGLEYGNKICRNGAAGIGITASTVTEIRNNSIEWNGCPGISVIAGSNAGLIIANTLDHNGTNCTAGLAVLSGSCATIKNTAISSSGTVGISIFDPGTSVSLENCTINDSGQCAFGPNLTVQEGASATVTGCTLNSNTGSPNITVSGNGTALIMSGCTAKRSTKPGLVTTLGAKITIEDTVFDDNGKDATAGVLIDGCEVILKGVTIRKSAHHGLIISNCTGKIERCEFYQNAYAGGGQIVVNHCALDIIRNLLYDPAGFYNQIRLAGESACRIYHNTIVGNATGGAGPVNRGPGDGLFVDATSTADVRNNIFAYLPRGISQETASANQSGLESQGSLGEFAVEARVTASTNCFYFLFDGGAIGKGAIVQNPGLTEGYYLQAGSVCIDAAELIPGVNDTFIGQGPDIGAREGTGPCSDLVLELPSALTVEDLAFSLTLSASASSGSRLSFGIENAPEGATLIDHGNNTATFSWIRTEDQIGLYQPTFTVTSGECTVEGTLEITAKSPNHPPSLSAIGNKTVSAGQQLKFQVAAKDVDKGDTLSYFISGKPQGANFDPSSRFFTWTPSDLDQGVYAVTFTVKDNRGGTASETITITVQRQSQKMHLYSVSYPALPPGSGGWSTGSSTGSSYGAGNGIRYTPSYGYSYMPLWNSSYLPSLSSSSNSSSSGYGQYSSPGYLLYPSGYSLNPSYSSSPAFLVGYGSGSSLLFSYGSFYPGT